MAANKSDLYANEAVPEEKARTFAKEIGAVFKLTSACTAAGVEKLFYNVGCKYLDPNFKDDDDGNSDSNKTNTNEEKKEEVTNNQNQPSEKEKNKEPVKEEKKENPKEKPKETDNKDQAKGMKLNKANTKPKKKKKCC